jgi:hypothetical protein
VVLDEASVGGGIEPGNLGSDSHGDLPATELEGRPRGRCAGSYGNNNVNGNGNDAAVKKRL